MQAILLPVGADCYALPVEWVGEVVGAPAVTPLVTAPATVRGLLNLRGEIVPLLDTAGLLGVGRVEQVAFAVVLTTELGPVGLSATGFPRRTVLEGQHGPSELPGTDGTYQVGNRAVVLLDPGALLASERFGGENRIGTAAAKAAV